MRRSWFYKGLSQQTAQKRTVHLHHVWKIQIKHVANRLFHQWVIASDVENAVAAQKIEVRLVIHVVEIRALRSRIHLVKPDDALGCYERAIYVPIVQFIIFAKTRGNNLLQIESHETKTSAIRVRNANCVGRLCQPRKLSGFTAVTDSRQWPGFQTPYQSGLIKKLQDSERILQLKFANSASLNLQLSHAQRCDARSVPCNKHELFGQLAVAPSQLFQPRRQCLRLCRERNSPGPARP